MDTVKEHAVAARHVRVRGCGGEAQCDTAAPPACRVGAEAVATALFARQGFFQLCTRMVEERHTDVYLQQIGCAFVGAAATYGACPAYSLYPCVSAPLPPTCTEQLLTTLRGARPQSRYGAK